MKNSLVALALLGIIVTGICHAGTLHSLNDQELAKVAGQSLFNLSYIAPGGSNPNGNIGFYRLGLEAELGLNANIKKLQLGCGGSNGAGCDIDIDNIALTGITTSTAQGAGLETDFKLTNPFVEFAIENPTSAAKRTVTGFRLGALSALGIMSIGSNSDLTTLSDDKGINSLSGDIGIRVTNATLTNVSACLVSTTVGCVLSGTANVADYSTTLVARRSSTFSLTGMTAQASASLLGLKLTNVNMNNIPYATTHQLMIADTDSSGKYIATSNASLSLQSKNIYWQNVSDGSWRTIAAEKGWWISLPTTQFSNLTMSQAVKLNAFDAIGGALGQQVDLAGVDLGQIPINNCYGNLSFC